jgi:uncharacterized transporter YbjL
VLTVQLSVDLVTICITAGSGLVLLLILTKTKLIEKLFTRIVQRLLKKWTRIYVNDYDSLLNLSAEFEVTKFTVPATSWFANREISDLKLTDEAVLILAVRRADGYFIGTPKSSTIIYEGDQVIMCGREPQLRRITVRPAGKEGDEEHQKEIENQLRYEGKEIPVGKKGTLFGTIKSIFHRKK